MGDLKRNWAVREGPWKLLLENNVPTPGHTVPGGGLKNRLYHLEDDPHEQHDLLSTHSKIALHLEDEIKAFHQLVKPSIETEEVKARTRELLERRQDNPALDSLPRVDGSPSHWIGAGATQRNKQDAAKLDKKP